MCFKVGKPSSLMHRAVALQRQAQQHVARAAGAAGAAGTAGRQDYIAGQNDATLEHQRLTQCTSLGATVQERKGLAAHEYVNLGVDPMPPSDVPQLHISSALLRHHSNTLSTCSSLHCDAVASIHKGHTLQLPCLYAHQTLNAHLGRAIRGGRGAVRKRLHAREVGMLRHEV